MTISPQKLREVVFLLLYSFDFTGSDESDLIEMLMHQLAVSKKVVKRAIEEKQHVQERLVDIDLMITQYSESYEFERIPRVERNILRLGIYEMLFSPSVPSKVAIAEAIRLTRKFSTFQAANFVNAILDAIYQKKEQHIHALSLSV